jgi:hypothetical protein
MEAAKILECSREGLSGESCDPQDSTTCGEGRAAASFARKLGATDWECRCFG